jgi:hypothetical protein
MRRHTVLKILGCLAVAVAALLASPKGDPASAAIGPFGGTTTACSVLQQTYIITCVPPAEATLGSNSAACPGSSQYFPATDAHSVPIWWTYSNGSTGCVKVSYTPQAKTGPVVCEYWFYVPAGDATGQIVFGYWVGGTKYYYTLNEEPVSGWQPILTNWNGSGYFVNSAQPSSIGFQDNNGQTPGAYLLGWGRDSNHGVMQFCYGSG